MTNEKTWHTIALYSKEGCHLCEDAKEALLALNDEFDVVLEEFDITQDAVLFEKYKYRIPVMLIDNKVELELRIDEKKLRRALAEGYGPQPK